MEELCGECLVGLQEELAGVHKAGAQPVLALRALDERRRQLRELIGRVRMQVGVRRAQARALRLCGLGARGR